MTYTLRLTQTQEAENNYRVEIALEGQGIPRRTALSLFYFRLTKQDQEDIRWYLEDFLQYPLRPGPQLATRIENRMAEIGRELFKAMFYVNEDARDLWATLRLQLSDTRVEIVTGIAEAALIPWELIRDSKTDTPLALSVRTFVRAHPNAARIPRMPRSEAGPIRILLIICRPRGRQDVPFRSVAGRLIKGMNANAQEAFDLDVLRPPTFEQLAQTLRKAQAEGKPYHIVHFDGHGVYADVNEHIDLQYLRTNINPWLLSGARAGAHGYILFENRSLSENIQLVDGPTLGQLLVETSVSVLVLNACRSAHATPPNIPVDADSINEDSHSKVRAFGSFAHELIDAGVAGVVAMRYNVYVVTAAQFVADLYATLARGYSLGEAVTHGRKQLASQPLREIAYKPIPLQDWSVPVVYEAAPLILFTRPLLNHGLRITVNDTTIVTRCIIEPTLPASPDAGFFGRDESLLALDRAFDTHPIVLMHGYAGSGKTSTAAEFARWYALTGGVTGVILFTSFEQYKPLAKVLDQLEPIFGKDLELRGTQWIMLSDKERRELALQILSQIPVLWIWDNIETVTGFPAGTSSEWTVAEQQELIEFLRAIRGGKAKFLLTSRRAENGWLGDLPARITQPPMPMQERFQLTRALVEKRGLGLGGDPFNISNWRALLEFTQGNPLTITVLVGHALRSLFANEDQIEHFLSELRAGENVLADEISEGRSRSLGASLNYGFESEFSEAERKQLALLYLFQGLVDVNILARMGDPSALEQFFNDIGFTVASVRENPVKTNHCLSDLHGFTRSQGIALLDRAAEIGLLKARGSGLYDVHPALPWFFKNLFEQFYLTGESGKGTSEATRAYTEALSEFGHHCHMFYLSGMRTETVGVLSAEESNLLHARQLALKYGWLDSVIGTMQGLRYLYEHRGRRTEWARLVAEIDSNFRNPETDGPLPGLEDHWVIVTEYKANIAREKRELHDAERLLQLLVKWHRQHTGVLFKGSTTELNPVARNAIRGFGAALQQLGVLLHMQGESSCVEIYEEAIQIAQLIDDTTSEALVSFSFGNVYISSSHTNPFFDASTDFVPVDLDKAEYWFRRSLELRAGIDRLGRARCLNHLGLVTLERYAKAREDGQSNEELLRLLNSALHFHFQALELHPLDAKHDLGVTYSLIGRVYASVGNAEKVISNWQKALHYFEAAESVYHAAAVRLNIAVILQGTHRLLDAKDYAYAALSGFESYSNNVVDEVQRVRNLIARIDEQLQVPEVH